MVLRYFRPLLRIFISYFFFFSDITIFIVSFVWLCWMPKEVPPLSVAQILMLLRCFRPLRIFILVPHMKRVVTELCKSFKEIILVSVLLIVLIFIFANWGVHLFGLRFASCNDKSITSRYVKCLHHNNIHFSFP